MFNRKALAIALTIGVATAATGIASASTPKSSAEFKTMIESIQTKQAQQRAELMVEIKNTRSSQATGAKSATEFQAMLETIHAKQAKNRAAILKAVK